MTGIEHHTVCAGIALKNGIMNQNSNLKKSVSAGASGIIWIDGNFEDKLILTRRINERRQNKHREMEHR